MSSNATGPGTTRVPEDYRVYGLRVRSEIELVGWPRLAAGPEPDVRVRLGPVDAPEPPDEAYRAAGHVEAGRVLLAVRGVARYEAEGGSRIRVEPAPEARPEDVLLYLMGSIIGSVLHQRGCFPLHAAAVEIGGVAVAFAGESGAGKSTMVALLTRRGAGFVTDDISVIQPLAGDRVGVWPGATRVKLDPQGLGALNESRTDLAPAGGNRQKLHLPVESALDADAGPVPLRRLYILCDTAGEPGIEPLSGLEATRAVVDETYFVGLVPELGLAAQNFRLAAAVARSVKVCRLLRPRGFEHLERVAELVEADVGRG